MELRRFNHFHYIHGIKGGLMTTVLNINSRGKPAIVFKKLTDIYESIYDKAQESLPTRWSREGLEENILDGCELKVETQVLYAERKLFNDETEVSDSDSIGDTDGQESDVEADGMTLKQIMESCKKRKLRQLKPADSSKKKLRTCSRQELNRSCLLSDEDDSDLDVVLSIWKSKLSKRNKLKIKSDESRISTCLPYGQTIGNSDPINSDQDLLPSSSDLPILVDIKVETPETNVKEIQNKNCIMDELSLLCDENVHSCLNFEPIGADGLLISRELTVSKKEAEYCVLNCASHEILDGHEPGPLQMVGESSTEWMKDNKLEVHKPHHSDSSASESMEGQYASNCVSNDTTSEAMSLTEEQCLGTNISQGKSITHEVICQNNSEDMSEAISVTEEQCSDTYISEGKPFIHEAICMNNGEVFTHLHGMADLYSVQLPEMGPGAEVHLTDSDKDKLAFDSEKGIPTESISDCNLNPEHGGSISSKSSSDCHHSSPDYGKSISTNSSSDRNLSLDRHLISIDEYPAKERQPQMSDYSDSEINTVPDFHLDGSMDKLNQFEEPKCHPTMIRSTRTTISPTSQERLSKSMKSMRLQDKEWKTCGGKLDFNQIKYKVDTAEESDHMKRVYSDTYHEQQNTRKSKKRSLHTASTTKVPRARMRNSTAQNWSDSAIAFTQRQMQDIECLALKLTTQLKSMKAIVEDRFHVEGNKATSYKFNTDEVRTSIDHSTKAEASARKWLSMMSRDCNRFCKIMKTTDHGSNASPTATAVGEEENDEAGGKLCEAKLLGDDVNAESFVETSPEKV